MTRYRSPKPSIPFVFLYDITGGQSFTTSLAYHTWDTEKIITSSFTYNNGKIYLNTMSSGLYKVTFECSYQGAGSGIARTRIYKNGTIEVGSRGRVSFELAKRRYVSISYIVYLEIGDYLQIGADTSASSITTIAGTSRLIIEFIPMQGWNNSSGGRSEYKGGVIR